MSTKTLKLRRRERPTELQTLAAAVEAARERWETVNREWCQAKAEAEAARGAVLNAKSREAVNTIVVPRGGAGHKPPKSKLEVAADEARAKFEAIEPWRHDAKLALDHAEAALLEAENAKLLRWIENRAREFEELRRTGAPSRVIEKKLTELREAVPDGKVVRRNQQLSIPDWIRQLVRADIDEFNTPVNVLAGCDGGAWERRRAAILAEPESPPLEPA